MLENNNLSEDVSEIIIQEEKKESWLIEIIDGLPRSYMDTQYLNPGITYFENSVEVEKSEIDINNLKLYRLKDGKFEICKKLQQEEYEKSKENKINAIKKELTALKTEYSEKEFVFKDIYIQKNRELDKNNLNNVVTGMLVEKKTTFNDWKFKDRQGDDVYVTLTIQDILELYKTMTGQTTKSMHIETDLRNRISTMSYEELLDFNAREEYEVLWNS